MKSQLKLVDTFLKMVSKNKVFKWSNFVYKYKFRLKKLWSHVLFVGNILISFPANDMNMLLYVLLELLFS